MFSLQTCPVSRPSCIRSEFNNPERNFVSTKEGSDKAGSFQSRWILPSIVSRSEKRRRPEASVRFECIKPIYRNRTFQNGEFGNIEVSSKQGRLYDKLRPNGCLPDGSHASGLPEISSFSVGGQNFSIYRNAIRAKFGPEALHENHEASCGLAAEPRGSVSYLSGRYFDYSVVSRNIEQPQKAGRRLAGVSRIPNQLQKVESNSIPTDYVLRDAGRFGFNAAQFILPPMKSVQIQKDCSLLLHTPYPTIRHLSRVLGLLESCCPAVWSAPLHYRQIQTLQITALQRWSNYDTPVVLTPAAKSDLLWWITALQTQQGSRIILPIADLTIASDASKQGWGASWGTKRSGGVWSKEEPQDHINILELRAAFFALKSFLSNQTNRVICLKMDNTISISSCTAHPRQDKCRSGYGIQSEAGSE